MPDVFLLTAVLDSLNQPILVADTNHITIYMNKAAIKYYKGGANLIGRSLMDCHNPESQARITEILAAFDAGENERLYAENEKRRLYMHAVRSASGELLGYYEWYYWKE